MNSQDVWDGEKICRICHLSTEESLETGTTSAASANSMDLIQLGCGCKDELGIAHRDCAEDWFEQRGNRVCEICGETAKNVGKECWWGQPFCMFLMTCLVFAFAVVYDPVLLLCCCLVVMLELLYCFWVVKLLK